MRLRVIVVTLLLVALSAGVLYASMLIGRRYQINAMCCLVPRARNLPVSVGEVFGWQTFYSQLGQDRWVLETVFPGVRNGFFLDVGSWDGTWASNSKAAEDRGWTGICIDPFPQNMEDRTCRMVTSVVGGSRGVPVTFRQAGPIGGIEDTLHAWKASANEKQPITLYTETLEDILRAANAPAFIHYLSIDIEGGELDALSTFPFDRYRFGAITIERQPDVRQQPIEALLKAKGYKRVHTWHFDDFYVPQESPHPVWERYWGGPGIF